MAEKTLAELEAETASAKKAAEDAGGTDEALNKAATDAEALSKAKALSQKSRYTEKEQAAFSLKKNAERLKELGGNPDEVLGRTIVVDESLPDDKPLTVKDLRDIQKSDAKQTALQMADAIEDEDEREKVRSILQTRIVPSGNATEDFRLARGAANAERNAKIAEEAQRRTAPRNTASGASQGARTEDAFEPTAEELVFMRPPYNLKKEQIIARRQKEAQ